MVMFLYQAPEQLCPQTPMSSNLYTILLHHIQLTTLISIAQSKWRPHLGTHPTPWPHALTQKTNWPSSLTPFPPFFSECNVSPSISDESYNLGSKSQTLLLPQRPYLSIIPFSFSTWSSPSDMNPLNELQLNIFLQLPQQASSAPGPLHLLFSLPRILLPKDIHMACSLSLTAQI